MKLYAKKSLGQHFLNSKHVLGQIIEAAQLQKGETVLEIGPGTGILTEALLEAGANVVAIEKDHRAIELLRIRFEVASQSGQLVVIEGDILDEGLIDQLSMINRNNGPETTVKRNVASLKNREYSIVANIPYYITGAILEKFLEHEPRPNRMVLLVQKEVAERIVAGRDEKALNKKESILSISIKAFGKPTIITSVPRGAFTPAPTVDSAVLSITNISDDRFTEKHVAISRFFSLVKAGFAHKRKFLIRNLEPEIDPTLLDQIWNQLKLDKKIRAEDVSVEQWIDISHVWITLHP